MSASNEELKARVPELEIATGDDSVPLALDWLHNALFHKLEGEERTAAREALVKARNNYESLLLNLSESRDAISNAIGALSIDKDSKAALKILRMWCVDELTWESQRLGLYGDI